MTPFEVEAGFLEAARARDLIIHRLLADGCWHRCDVEGKGGGGDGSYYLHTDGRPNGGFENHRDGRGVERWKADVAAVLTSGEKAKLKARAERQRQAREAERANAAEEAARRAAQFWSRGRDPDPAHSYLRAKGIAAPPGVRQLGDLLLVPVRDAGVTLRGLQFIGPEGRKNLLRGTPKTGCAFRIGTHTPVIGVTEGFATGVSVHAATGFCVLAAFDCDNLVHIAKLVRARMPSARLVVCGDADFRTPGNPGRTKAKKAAEAVGGVAILPAFGTDRGERDTDFNDLLARCGLDAVRRQIMEALG